MSDKKNSAFTAGIGYTIGNILIKGIGILTLPLFSRIMTTAEFGVYNVFVSYDSLLYVIISLALHSCVQNANRLYKGKIDDFVSSISLIYIGNMALFMVIAVLFGEQIGQLLGLEHYLIFALILYSFGSAILTLYNTWVSLSYAYKQYLIVALINSLGNVLVSLLLIFTVFRSQRDIGRIVGSTAVITCLAVALLGSIFKRARPRIDRSYWKFAIRYSLPIVPHGISQVLLGQFDRIMIRSLVSDAAAGIYSLAGNIKIIITVISSSVSTVWTTWFYGEMNKQNTRDIRTRATQLTALFAIMTVGVMALSPELVLILGGREYDLAKYVAVPMAMDAFILFMYELVSCGEYYAQKTLYIMYGTIGAAILNVILNYIFIQKYGFIAAAYTTLFAYVCYLLLHILICRRVIGFCIIPLEKIALFSGIVVAAAAIDLIFVDSLLIRWGACALIVIPIALYLLRQYGISELKALIKK